MGMQQGQINPNAEWMCCLGCGRETKAKWGYCFRCSDFCQKTGRNTSQVPEKVGDRQANPYYHNEKC